MVQYSNNKNNKQQLVSEDLFANLTVIKVYSNHTVCILYIWTLFSNKAMHKGIGGAVQLEMWTVG